MDKLGLDELFVPPGAGVGSAIGFLRAPFAYEAVRSLYTRTDQFDFEAVNLLLAELTAEAETFVRKGTDAELTVERQVSMRYKGQGWEIPVRLDGGAFDEFAADALAGIFTKAYEEFFGRAIDDLPIEAVSWSVRVASVQDLPERLELVEPGATVEGEDRRPIFDPISGRDLDAAVIQRHAMSPGDVAHGPGVIVESQTTTVLASHHQAVMQADGSLLVTRRQTNDSASDGSMR
jgi:N-methylhydantoinase A